MDKNRYDSADHKNENERRQKNSQRPSSGSSKRGGAYTRFAQQQHRGYAQSPCQQQQGLMTSADNNRANSERGGGRGGRGRTLSGRQNRGGYKGNDMAESGENISDLINLNFLDSVDEITAKNNTDKDALYEYNIDEKDAVEISSDVEDMAGNSSDEKSSSEDEFKKFKTSRNALLKSFYNYKRCNKKKKTQVGIKKKINENENVQHIYHTAADKSPVENIDRYVINKEVRNKNDMTCIVGINQCIQENDTSDVLSDKGTIQSTNEVFVSEGESIHHTNEDRSIHNNNKLSILQYYSNRKFKQESKYDEQDTLKDWTQPTGQKEDLEGSNYSDTEISNTANVAQTENLTLDLKQGDVDDISQRSQLSQQELVFQESAMTGIPLCPQLLDKRLLHNLSAPDVTHGPQVSQQQQWQQQQHQQWMQQQQLQQLQQWSQQQVKQLQQQQLQQQQLQQWSQQQQWKQLQQQQQELQQWRQLQNQQLRQQPLQQQQNQHKLFMLQRSGNVCTNNSWVGLTPQRTMPIPQNTDYHYGNLPHSNLHGVIYNPQQLYNHGNAAPLLGQSRIQGRLSNTIQQTQISESASSSTVSQHCDCTGSTSDKIMDGTDSETDSSSTSSDYKSCEEAPDIFFNTDKIEPEKSLEEVPCLSTEAHQCDSPASVSVNTWCGLDGNNHKTDTSSESECKSNYNKSYENYSQPINRFPGTPRHYVVQPRVNLPYYSINRPNLQQHPYYVGPHSASLMQYPYHNMVNYNSWYSPVTLVPQFSNQMTVPNYGYNLQVNMHQHFIEPVTQMAVSNQGNATPRSQKNKFVYEDYWTREGVQAGLKKGMLIEGAIRINPKNYEDGYVPHPDGVSDVYICGQKNRNRALNGDIVAVLIFPREEWKVLTDDLEVAASDLQAQFDGLNLKSDDPVADATESTKKCGEGGDATDSSDVIVEEEYEEAVEVADKGDIYTPSKLTENLTEPNDSVGDCRISANDKTVSSHVNLDQGDNKHLNLNINPSNKSNRNATNSPKNPQTPGQRTPRKAYTMLKDLATENHNCSPVVKKLFSSSSKNRHEVGEQGDVVVKQRLDAVPLNLLLRTGKVVYIIEKKHSRACTGHIKLLQDRNPDTALFSPSDHRLPRILIPMSDCPQGFYERPEDHIKTLFVARITEWEGTGNMAKGQLARSLGEAGQIQPETEGILMECDVDYGEFPQQAIECLPPASNENPWQIPAEEFEKRRDFRKECVFTIDPASARDLDDALHVIDLGNGVYEVGVHIADVSYFVTPDSALDEVAASRATSVYMVQMVIPMLPRLLCEQLCSLNPDEDRLTFSVVWKMTETGEILDEWFGRSVIRSCAKLSYGHAQGFLDNPDKTWSTDELPPITNGYQSEIIKQKVLIMDKIAKNLRKNRYDEGALSLNQVKMQFTLDKGSGMPCGYSVYEQRDSNKLIEEFMLLANMAVAHKIYTTFPEVAVLRRHAPPQDRQIDGTVAMLKNIGVDIDASGSKSLQTSLIDNTGDDAVSRSQSQILTLLFAKTMQLAKYFCTGCIEDDELYRHYALSVPLYTHFTSPIRRYPDIMVHRLLGAAVGCNDLPSLDKDEAMKKCTNCNDKKLNSKVAQELSSEMFFAVFVKECGPLEEKGVVVKAYDRAFDVFFLKLGIVKRVYLEKLPLQKFTFNTNKSPNELTLFWKSDGEHPVVKPQDITLFTPVNCVLEAADVPLKWNVVIKHPDDPLIDQEIKSKLPDSTFTPDMKICYEDI